LESDIGIVFFCIPGDIRCVEGITCIWDWKNQRVKGTPLDMMGLETVFWDYYSIWCRSIRITYVQNFRSFSCSSRMIIIIVKNDPKLKSV
jgi:hypothetical protein